MEQQAMLSPGTLLRGGAYRVEKALSSGGFGNTYVVTNLNFDEVCAMKEFFMKGINLRNGNTVTVSVPDNRPSFDAQRDKFKKEAQRLWKLKNDHIVHVHDLFEENGTVYYVMDFIDGESLAERLKRMGRPLTEDELEPLLRQALDALETVHDQKIWHLDIKPANMMVDRQGHLYLIDFGASKQLHTSDGHSVATSSAMAFTPGYAPLEQTDQNFRLFGPWTDLYALGASIYKLLTADTPPSASEIIAMGGRPLFPPVVSPRMQHLVAWMMNPAFTQRPQSAADVLKFLNTPFVVEDEQTVMDTTSLPIEEETVITTPPPTPKPAPKPESKPAQEPDPISEPEPAPVYEDDEPKSKTPWGLIVGIVMVVVAFCGVGGFGYLLLSGNSTEEDVVTASADPANTQQIVTIPFTSSFGDNGQYTGPVDEDGKPQGDGKVVFDNGCTYNGPFLHGLMQGANATYTYKDGSRFEGTMNADHFSDGTYTATDGSYFQGTFDASGQPLKGAWYGKNGKVIEKVG